MQIDTRTQLLTAAEMAVRQRGYAGFSYTDLTAVVGIRKASIHHHFPTKEDLGVALVDLYSERFAEALDEIAAASSLATDRLAAYAGLYRAGLEAGQGCLCGVLASELVILPERVQAGVRRFFKLNLAWLTQVLREGRDAGTIRRDGELEHQAAAVLAGLEGAMLVGRALSSVASFDGAASATLAGLRVPYR